MTTQTKKYWAEYYLKNKERIIKRGVEYVRRTPAAQQRMKKWNQDNKDKTRVYGKVWRRKNQEKYFLAIVKARAKRLGLEFNLDLADIVIPIHCPILGIPLLHSWEEGYTQMQSPSIDRVDNSKGYVKGNVRVISNKANRCKSDLTIKDVENLYKYVKGELP